MSDNNKLLNNDEKLAVLTAQLMPDPYEEDADDDKRENDQQDD